MAGTTAITKGNLHQLETNNVHITVSYTYECEALWATPGDTILFANPNLGALTGATWTGGYC